MGKRILPNLPKIIGAWIAGIYDNDRLVHRAALESFTKVFTTEDKRNNVWRIYQGSILDFVDDVILHQTALTLSDERTVKRDDAEGKYSRVAGAAILLFNRVLGMLKPFYLAILPIQPLIVSRQFVRRRFAEEPIRN